MLADPRIGSATSSLAPPNSEFVESAEISRTAVVRSVTTEGLSLNAPVGHFKPELVSFTAVFTGIGPAARIWSERTSLARPRA
jgi:hypothetical protein